MGLRIFETDPDAAPKQRFSDDLVGRFRSGYQINGRPASLSDWRVTTGDPEVASAVQSILGGDEPQEWEAQGEDNIELFTSSNSVDVILDGPNAIRSEMVLWGRQGAIRRCDGVEQKGDDAGKPCECPATFADRKDAAKSGKGCEPSITVYFALKDDPELGRFSFRSGSWSLARDIGLAEADLAKIDGPAYATLSLEVVEYEANGKKRSFTKPVVKITGPAPVATNDNGQDDEPPF